MKLLLIAPCLLFAATAFADMDPNMDMGSGSQSQGAKKFMDEMNVGMKKMDQGMSGATMTGNVDHDFAAMMIPHHQGAIDMAKGELEYGKDPEMRALAKNIIAAQKVEIKQMTEWMKTSAGK
jgi:uncharacterized protein (DUF305 family)